MTRNKNDDDASSLSGKRLKSFENGCVVPWSDLNHDVLFLVMMQLGVVEFLAFSGVCKSWRSFAVSERNTFMASRPPMSVSIKPRGSNFDSYCHLEDFQRKSFKTIIPHSAGRTCVGLTCGYLILFRMETRDFWLVNPITRHELYFPKSPIYGYKVYRIRAILVFSPSISGWVFVVLHRKFYFPTGGKEKISFSIAGKRGWKHVYSTLTFLDLHVLNGKIYILHTNCQLGELRLDLNRKGRGRWILLEIKNLTMPNLFYAELVSSGEKLYVMDYHSRPRKFLELHFGKMEWVSPENTNTIGEYAVFHGDFRSSAVIKPESLLDFRYDNSINHDINSRVIFYNKPMWYFLHDCLNVDHIDA